MGNSRNKVADREGQVAGADHIRLPAESLLDLLRGLNRDTTLSQFFADCYQPGWTRGRIVARRIRRQQRAGLDQRASVTGGCARHLLNE